MSEFKSGFVAMLGRTNVGKSTLVNLLVGEKIAATANKVQTTRTAIRGIVNRENSQIIFIDTPGIHKPKTKLNETMIETSFGVIKDIDLILFVIEATSDEIGRGDMRILGKIKESKKKAILIINKIDLQDSYIEIKEEYSRVGYKVIVTSAKENKGIEEVKEILKNKVSVFSGNSGVGKSSLINAIFDTDKTQEGEVSKKNKKGKNTTTDTKLYEIEENTYIADTPGFSSFEINEIESSELDKYFIEIEKELGNCEFVGCTHIKEEKCGVKQAVQNRKISQGRYERFCEIYNELKDKEKYKWK